jgi:hypothetical protein
MTERKRDLPFEALAEVTSTDWTVGRGILNAALRDIRTQQPGLEDVELANEIVYRAKLYRRMFPDIAITPPALAKHWLRIFEENKRSSATNQATVRTDCQTCDGHRFVVVSTRPAATTQWMKEHGFSGSGEIEEYAPCPDCASDIDASWRRFDGTWARPPDPEKVRQMLSS